MRKLLIILFLAFIACSIPEETINKTESQLASTTCSSFHPARSVDAWLSDGSCSRYLIPSSPLNGQYTIIPTTNIIHVDTGPVGGAWVCNTSSPVGAPGQPCFSGGINNGFRRIRGPVLNKVYQGASRDITGIIGLSLVVAEHGNLFAPSPGLPTCPYQLGQAAPPTNWHACGTLSDMGLPDFTANNDPSDSTTCCQTSAQWPSGSFGSSCVVNDAPGIGYTVVNYPPAGVNSCPIY